MMRYFAFVRTEAMIYLATVDASCGAEAQAPVIAVESTPGHSPKS